MLQPGFGWHYLVNHTQLTANGKPLPDHRVSFAIRYQAADQKNVLPRLQRLFDLVGIWQGQYRGTMAGYLGEQFVFQPLDSRMLGPQIVQLRPGVFILPAAADLFFKALFVGC